MENLAVIGIKTLRNESASLLHHGKGFVLGGIDDRIMGKPDWQSLTAQQRPHLLMAHNPDFFYEAEQRGIPLIVSGHTHGGQIRFPRGHAIIRQSRYCLDEGVYAYGSTLLVVSRGLGSVMGAQLIGQVLSAGVGMVNPGYTEAFSQAYGLGVNMAVILPWGRAQESEADHIGLILMAKAGYDPSVAVGFWERMSKLQQGGKPPEFLSTHPSDETRIAQIKQWVPEAMTYYKKQ